MSRIGKMPIAIPAGVTVDFKDGVVTVKGPKGTLTREVVGNVSVETEGANVVLKALDDSAETNAKHGLYRALVNGMVTGVSAGFVKSLEVKGTALRCNPPRPASMFFPAWARKNAVKIPWKSCWMKR